MGNSANAGNVTAAARQSAAKQVAAQLAAQREAAALQSVATKAAGALRMPGEPTDIWEYRADKGGGNGGGGGGGGGGGEAIWIPFDVDLQTTLHGQGGGSHRMHSVPYYHNLTIDPSQTNMHNDGWSINQPIRRRKVTTPSEFKPLQVAAATSGPLFAMMCLYIYIWKSG
jgi:hypothetical protein